MLFDAKIFGANVRLLRKRSGLTQEQLAEKLNISTSYLGKIEIGSRTPSIDLLLDLADQFGVTVDELLQSGRKGKPSSESIIAKMVLLSEELADLAASIQDLKL